MNETLRQAFEDAAGHLSGRQVILNFKQPRHPQGAGECYKSDTGAMVINIKPGLDHGRAVYVALHEAAHIKLMGETLPPVTEETMQSFAGKTLTRNTVQDEDEADHLAMQWIVWAKEITKNSVNWQTSDEDTALAYMTALKFYK